MMSERLPIEIVFWGEPFDREAVKHTLRHLAMRVGWTIRPKAAYKFLYATTDDPGEIRVQEGDLVILSSPAVKEFMAESSSPIPVMKSDSGPVPFCHPRANDFCRQGWIGTDVIAGVHALLNLLYERRNRHKEKDGWILFEEDWWLKAGFTRPEPLADLWLDRIALEAEKIGWPSTGKQERDRMNPAAGTLILTHDVDYMPTRTNRGAPRFFRALLRQLLVRRSVGDAVRIIDRYCKRFIRNVAYNEIQSIAGREAALGAVSSFQFTVRRSHRWDPSYNLQRQYCIDSLRHLVQKGFEICLHGSYKAARIAGQLREEKFELERIAGSVVSGHRQHYLNFHPVTIFLELEKAGFRYDMSVGYNDMSGPRAGTLFPYRPYNVEKAKPYTMWEIPFVLMDTTLATTYRFSPDQAIDHCMEQIRQVNKSGGCVSIIWHQEQLSGILDPGFEELYWTLLGEIRTRGMSMTSGGRIVPAIDEMWDLTYED